MSRKVGSALGPMLWYLLSPLRGTTQPPRLSAGHPIRRAFYRHGKTTATHWMVVMLFSVAIAMGFSYPTLFLSNNPTAGFSAFPHHVWTTTKPIDDGTATIDVEMRQVWVHGSYMHALDKEVLKRGLAVQQSLVGDEGLSNSIPALDDKLRSSTLQWGYHSPLMYWNNSADMIDADPDILRTINEQKQTPSSLNVVLRPASVFAGKKFDRRRLLAADALVITLVNKIENGAGHTWQHKMQALSHGSCDDCTLFPSDGNVTRKRVYEFSFMPLSAQEHIALTLAYSCMALYVLVALRRMKAFHSRFGLVVTAITQMTCSILASFTICAILKINLSTIPQNAYPFVVLVLGVENMFRLINAVLAYPPTMPTEIRIANALGDIGPISVAAAAQNLAILAILSTVVSPGVAAFCAFAAIATLFDVFFLLTFFVAVLNVDIHRLELQDAIVARHSQPPQNQRSSLTKDTWFDALVQGRLPFSTRMAGTAVTTTFVLSLNYHFFEHKEKASNLRHLLSMLQGGPPSLADLDTFAPPPMNASLTPGEWMRMQDFDTAKEVMRLAKPGEDSFVVRVFAPLVVVLGGSDRTDVSGSGEIWTHALRSFVTHHFYPVAVAVVFILGFVTVLMNFLLYNTAGDEDNPTALRDMGERLTATAIGLPHKLDIVKMASSDNGHLITISLDRTIAVSVADRSNQTHYTIAIPRHVLDQIKWPVHHLAIDDAGEWIACHCADDRILAYNCSTGSLVHLVQFPDDHPAIIFSFTSLTYEANSKLYFLVLTSGARLAMSCMEDGMSSGVDLVNVPLVGASLIDTPSQCRRLFVVTEEADIVSYTWNGLSWIQVTINNLRAESPPDRLSGPVGLQTYTDLDTALIVATFAKTVLFLDSTDLSMIVTLELPEDAVAGTHLENVLLGPIRTCPACSGTAFRKVAVASQNVKGECIMTTWSVSGEHDSCFCLSQNSPTCLKFDDAMKDTQTVSSPEAWKTVGCQTLLGLRRRQQHDPQAAAKRLNSSQLRQRRHARPNAQGLKEDLSEGWEAYRLSLDTEMETLDVPPDSQTALAHNRTLYVHNAGPVVALDAQAVAVAVGNSLEIIRSSRRASISRHVGVLSLERQSSLTSTRER
ncbi:Sterol regulatory element-binding protein cleavage-activating protein [Fulvia fulva]|nr:Sterol regulatory element-binding protein cleavage-activating protein [Fulvia fulva]WPV08998.1 Sterol regulatory element-binding protein cleavage-activating protein [Fulvia fulva]WPV24171.1 Sterol regulatory element-binding protein cleavage-activating protein [Fulvia fulva]